VLHAPILEAPYKIRETYVFFKKLKCYEFFLTVDKGILKKSTEISQIKVINPINLISEWEA